MALLQRQPPVWSGRLGSSQTGQKKSGRLPGPVLGRVASFAVTQPLATPPHRARRTTRLIAAAALFGALAVALPVSPAAAARPASAAATAPKPWAKAVCGALDGWVRAVTVASKKAATAPPTSAAATKKRLTALLARTTKETAKLRKRLAAAGKPSVSGGKQVAATIAEGFRQVESSLKGAKHSLAAAPSSDPAAFGAAARASQDALESGLESIQAGFSAVRDADAGPLLVAFRTQKACQAVVA